MVKGTCHQVCDSSLISGTSWWKKKTTSLKLLYGLYVYTIKGMCSTCHDFLNSQRLCIDISKGRHTNFKELYEKFSISLIIREIETQPQCVIISLLSEDEGFYWRRQRKGNPSILPDER